MRRDRSEMLAVIGHQATRGGAAEAVRLLQDRLEHRPRIAGGAVDGVQHLGQCSDCLVFFETYRRTPELTREALATQIPEAVRNSVRNFLRTQRGT